MEANDYALLQDLSYEPLSQQKIVCTEWLNARDAWSATVSAIVESVSDPCPKYIRDLKLKQSELESDRSTVLKKLHGLSAKEAEETDPEASSQSGEDKESAGDADGYDSDTYMDDECMKELIAQLRGQNKRLREEVHTLKVQLHSEGDYSEPSNL